MGERLPRVQPPKSYEGVRASAAHLRTPRENTKDELASARRNRIPAGHPCRRGAGHRPVQAEGPDQLSGPSVVNALVAGAGFEPATSGL